MSDSTTKNDVLPADGGDEQTFVRNVSSWFNQAYYFYRERTWFNTRWMGVPVHKPPTDLWVYQEILFETRPTLIVETGTADGGGALYFSHVGDAIGNVMRVITVDVLNDRNASRLPRHPRIAYVAGSSVDAGVVAAVKSHVRADDRVMVVLDSDHARDHVLRELELYAPLVTSGCYLVVEDTNVNGHPVYPLHGPGPTEALEAWLPAHAHEFETDASREKFMLTFNPRGYLRRK